MGETAGFVFLNTTGASQTSKDLAKRARGHVTKVNFANRRKAKAEKREAAWKAAMITGDSHKTTDLNGNEVVWTCPRARQDKRRNSANVVVGQASDALLGNNWPLFFADETEHPEKRQRRLIWYQIVTSEPTFTDATLAVNLRHWSLKGSPSWAASAHFDRALNGLITKIQDGQVYSDGTLGVIFTLAFGERLASNSGAWAVHISGASKIIVQRRLRGIQPLAGWMPTMFVSDVFNYILGCPRVFHESLMDAIGFHGNETLAKVARLAKRVIQVRSSIDAYHQHGLDKNHVRDQIETPILTIRAEAQTLRGDADHNVQVFARAIDLLLHMSWPLTDDPPLHSLAREIVDALDGRELQPCSYYDLTSSQVMIAAVAAEGDAETRAWFAKMWRAARCVMRSRGWPDPMEMVEMGLQGDAGLLWRFHSLWREMDQ